MRKGLQKRLASYKVYWHKLIPFVIGEIKNPEWDKLEPLIKEGKLSVLSEMYNSNGNWYVLEGLDYFYFQRHIYTQDGFLFSDSMHLQYTKLPDEGKYQLLLSEAKSNIDDFWERAYKNITITNLINKLIKLYGKAITKICGSKK